MSEKYEKKLEDRILELETKLNEKTNECKLQKEFLAELAHETRTPLNAINGFLKIILDKNKQIKQKDLNIYSNIVLDSTKTLISMMDELSDLIKIETNKIKTYYETFSIKELLKQEKIIFSTRARNKQLDLILEKGEETKINSDKKRIKQITSNLIKNALKFTSQGKVNISYNSTENEINIVISDTGCGIKKEEQKKIFDRYEQFESNKIESGGTGIGLNYTKKLVELLGGEIKFNSEYKKGTEFIITLPKGNTNSKILIMEPKETTKSLLKTYLKKRNVEIEFEKKYLDGLKRTYKQKYDLIIIDCDNQENEIKKLKSEYKKIREKFNTPIVFYSNNSELDVKKEFDEFKIELYISKENSRDEFLK